jgi:spermidine/putrescine transport system substrate-binding protein
MKKSLKKMAIFIFTITFIMLCSISPPVFAGDKFPNYESPEACIAQAKKEGKVVLYDWAEWWPEELFTSFEKKYGIKVVRDHYESTAAMNTKFKLDPNVPYDLVASGSGGFMLLQKFGALKKLNHEWVPNIENYLMEEFKTTEADPNFEYFAPTSIYITAIAYNEDIVKPDTKDLDSWKIIFEKNEFANRMTALNDSYEAVGSALIYLGYNPNSSDEKELKEATDLLFKQKENLIAYDDYPTRMFAEQETVLSVMWAGDIWWTTQELPNIQMSIPKEGTMMGFDGLAIAKGGKNPAAAHLFLNWLWSPENHKILIEGIGYAPTHKATPHLISDEVKAFPAMSLSPEYLKKCYLPNYEAAVGKGLGLRAKIWEKLKM